MASQNRRLNNSGLTVDTSQEVGVQVQFLEAVHHFKISTLLNFGGVFLLILNLLILHKIIIKYSKLPLQNEGPTPLSFRSRSLSSPKNIPLLFIISRISPLHLK